MDYFESIQINHSLVSFSQANSIFYISLWNGILRDGRILDLDISFLEAKNPSILNNELHVDDKIFPLSTIQLIHLSKFFPIKN
jgi:hypothetical protein